MVRRTLSLLLALLTVSSCDWFGDGDGDDAYTLLVYVAGDNSISSYAEEDIYGYHGGSEEIDGLADGYLPSISDRNNVLLVYYDVGDDDSPKLVRFCRDRDGNFCEQLLVRYPSDQNSATMETFRSVIEDVETVFPASRRGIVLWSHGTGFLPVGYRSASSYEASAVSGAVVGPTPLTSFGEDHSSEIGIDELREAFGSVHYDYMLFDACLMGGVEVAYELKDCTDYIGFSPTEIMGDGMDYADMADRLFNIADTETAVITVSQDYMDCYFAKSRSQQCATWSVVRTDRLTALADACRTVYSGHRDRIQTLNRSGIQLYYSSVKCFYDLDDFVSRLADEDEYSAFSAALESAVIYRNATDHFLSIDIDHFCGLSTYVPYSNYTRLNNYYSTLEWNKASGLIQ